MSTFESGYGYARFVVGVLSFFGAVAAIIGIVGLGLSLLSVINDINNDARISFALLFVLGPAAALLVIGIVIIAFSELVRSQLDTADNTRHLLHSMKRTAPREKLEF